MALTSAASQKRITLLGVTGSIGQSTLSVLRQHPEKFRLVGVAARSNWQQLIPIIEEFEPEICAFSDAGSAEALREAISVTGRVKCPQLVVGDDEITQLAADAGSDIVVAGISGFAGLRSTWAAVASGKTVLLANKEALVASGRILLDLAKQCSATILPIDSEHNAVYQCASGLVCTPERIKKITLTASGGPFLSRDLSTFDTITVAEACKHPTWSMGRKISVDSATLMNKGLEVIEASLLFDRAADDIDVLIHPTSTVHALVEFVDCSVLAHLGPADMQVPIAHALGLPVRLDLSIPSLDLIKLATLNFYAVDKARYPALGLAYAALRHSQGACLVLNAANEVAVESFLQTECCYTDIVQVVEATLAEADLSDPVGIDDVFAKDSEARRIARVALARISERESA